MGSRFDVDGFPEDVVSRHPSISGCGGEVAGDHAQCGGFTCAIGTQKPDDVAWADVKGDVFDGFVSAESFAEMVDFDHGVVKREMVDLKNTGRISGNLVKTAPCTLIRSGACHSLHPSFGIHQARK
jgi:hypothetical protein